jgi:hypothetical protein
MGGLPGSPGEEGKDDHDCRDDKGEGPATERGVSILIMLHACAPNTSTENAAVRVMVPDSACPK